MRIKSFINAVASHFKHWEYGFIEGFIIGLIFLSFSDNAIFITILLTPLILAIVLISSKIVWPHILETKKFVFESPGYSCPECGSPRRHYKWCSKAKERK